MTTLTIQKGGQLQQNTFVNFDQLFWYLLREKKVSYTEMGILDKNDMSKEAYVLYKESKKLKKGEFRDVTNV